jgi:hypothetical protein
MWTLGHPDGDRTVIAARIIGSLRSRDASPALRQAVTAHRDPYLAVEALRSLIAIDGVGGCGLGWSSSPRRRRSWCVPSRDGRSIRRADPTLCRTPKPTGFCRLMRSALGQARRLRRRGPPCAQPDRATPGVLLGPFELVDSARPGIEHCSRPAVINARIWSRFKSAKHAGSRAPSTSTPLSGRSRRMLWKAKAGHHLPGSGLDCCCLENGRADSI